MNKGGFKKDQKEYIIFRCECCKQYSYVKKSQKTKTCLRCSRSYQVKQIQPELVIQGINKALEIVKNKQEDLAINQFNNLPELRAESDFRPAIDVVNDKLNSKDLKINSYVAELGEEYVDFLYELKEVSHISFRIPEYMLKILFEKAKVLDSEKDILLNRLFRKGILKKIKNGYIEINL